MTHRTFTSPKKQPAPPGHSFDLEGTRRNGEPWIETGFSTVSADDVPPGVYADLATAMWVADGKITYGRDGVLRFMEAVLVAEDRERWHALMRDTDRRVDLALVGEVMMWLVVELSDRPTGGQPSSPDGLSRTEGSSEESSPSPAG